MMFGLLRGVFERHDAEVLHDAFKLRERYGPNAEDYCVQALQSPAIATERRQLIEELLRALKLMGRQPSAY